MFKSNAERTKGLPFLSVDFTFDFACAWVTFVALEVDAEIFYFLFKGA